MSAPLLLGVNRHLAFTAEALSFLAVFAAPWWLPPLITWAAR